MIYDDTYFQTTYAGWLGKVIGVRLGSPMESWTYEKIRESYGEILDYVEKFEDYAADDDTNGPNFFSRVLLDFPSEKEVTQDQIAETLLNYVADHHGFFWWGGYGISTEQTSYENLRAGVDASLSGSISLNGKTVAEQIGGQIFSDVWGFIFPGNPEKAAYYSRKMSAISYDGEGLKGAEFVAAAVSAAYTEKNIRKVIETALRVIGDCGYARMARDVMAFYDGDSARDWRAAFGFVKGKYGYDKYPGSCHIIPNAAVMVLSMLYGEGDFSRTVCISCNCGWDTDCNAGNVGSILGVLVGLDGLEKHWTEPVHDLLISSSVIGQLNLDTVASSAERFARSGCKAAGCGLPAHWAERSVGHDILWHFDMIGSTQSIRCDNPETRISNIGKGVFEGHRALEIAFSGHTAVYFKTYCGQSDLTDSRYDPSFTPLIFPGQKLSFSCRNAGKDPVNATPFVLDDHDGSTHSPDAVLVGSGETVIIEYPLPPGTDWRIRRVGLALCGEGPSTLLLDSCRISGKADYRVDFSKEHVEKYLPSYGQKHEEVTQCSYSKGLWGMENGCVSGSCSDSADLLTGPYYAEDYTVECDLHPVAGSFHLLEARVQGLARGYAFGFADQNSLVLLKRKGIHETVVARTGFSREAGKTYRLGLKVSGNRIIAGVDGISLIDFTDENQPHLYGQVAMGVRNGSRCLFSNLTFSSQK